MVRAQPGMDLGRHHYLGILIDITPVLCTGISFCIKYSIMNKGGNMLPFARMVKYGNIKPTLPEIKKLDGSQLHAQKSSTS